MDIIIEDLKQNTSAFGLMSKEMQDKARELVRQGDMQAYDSDEGWEFMGSAVSLLHEYTYRLRPDYEQEQEVVKYEVYPENNRLYFKFDDKLPSTETSLEFAPSYPDFIGFLYEQGIVSSLPRMYQVLGLGRRNFFCEYGEHNIGHAEVLTPTHVLFREKK